MIRFIENISEKEMIASDILMDLPEWFGLPESTKEYISTCRTMPFFACYNDENTPEGFIVLKETSKWAAELYVMGVKKEAHHRGIGTELWNHFLNYAKENGYEYIQVKTVESGHYKEYDITNKFYQSLGFRQLEVFPKLWDENNPCQIYVKYIG